MAGLINTPTPASETKEGRKRLRAYRLALGAFIEAFSRCEVAMHFVLRWHTKTSVETSRAVFSGVRTDTAISFLKRLADVAVISPKEIGELDPILKQLKLINGQRNTILHYGASDVAEGRGFVTDAIMAITKDRAKTFPISETILDDMTVDLRKIFLHLATQHMGRPLRGSDRYLAKVLAASWRYTPPPQAKNHLPRTDVK